jgi:hypothetical protein
MKVHEKLVMILIYLENIFFQSINELFFVFKVTKTSRPNFELVGALSSLFDRKIISAR